MTSKECRRAERLLIESQDDALNGNEADFLRTHLATCGGCRQLSAQLAQQAEAFQTILPPDREPGQIGAIATRALAQWQAESNARVLPLRHRRAAVGWGVSGVALAGATALAVTMVAQEHAGSQPVVATNTTASPSPVLQQTNGPAISGESKLHKNISAPPRLTASATPKRYPPATLVPHRPLELTAVSHRKPNMPLHPAGNPIVAVDDLAIINADSAETLNRWARTTPDEWVTLEAQARASIRTGDDFVHVPFPRVAALGNRAIVAEAIANYRREASIVDPRLQQTISLSEKGTSFAELCQRIHTLTGVEIDADASVADDKVTLFCKNRPIREIMRQISQLFGFTWQRDPVADGYRYTLTQELQSQLLEEELRSRDHDAALAALDVDMQGYKPYLTLLPNAAQQMGLAEIDKQKRDFAAGKTPSPASLDRLRRLDCLHALSWAGVQLYFKLTTEQRELLERQQLVEFAPDSLPANLKEGILQGLRGVAVQPDASGNFAGFQTPANDSLQFSDSPVADSNTEIFSLKPSPDKPPVPLREWIKQHPLDMTFTLQIKPGATGAYRLEVGWLYRVEGANEGNSGTWDAATGISPSVLKPNNASLNRAVLNRTAKGLLQNASPLTLSPPKPTYLFHDDPTTLLPHPGAAQPQITYADAVQAFYKATGIDVISDDYTRYYDPSVVALPKPVPLEQGLNQVSDALGLRWGTTVDNGKLQWLTFRDAGFFNDRASEIPKRLFEHWAANRRATGYMPLRDIEEIILRLRGDQVDSVSNELTAKHVYGLREWMVVAQELDINGMRPFLRSLTLEQQDILWTKRGLGVADLTARQRELLQNVAYFSPDTKRVAGIYKPNIATAAEGGKAADLEPEVSFEFISSPP